MKVDYTMNIIERGCGRMKAEISGHMAGRTGTTSPFRSGQPQKPRRLSCMNVVMPQKITSYETVEWKAILEEVFRQNTCVALMDHINGGDPFDLRMRVYV